MSFLYKLYFLLPNFAKLGFIGKGINKILAVFLKRIFDFFIPRYFLITSKKAGFGLNIVPRKRKVIVSFTSFPARINDIWISVECILRQTYKPDMVILWLSKVQFPDENLPQSLLKLKDRGLTISFCGDDLKSHKKYLYALEQYPNDYIITLDDDLYYDNDLIKNIVELKQKYPDAVPTNRAHKITFNKDGLLPYNKWKHNTVSNKPSHNIVQTGGFGTLYEKTDLFKDFNNTFLIKELAFHADDLWLKIMVLLNNKKVVTNNRYNKHPITVRSSQIEKLVTKNVFEGGNDVQLANLLKFYNIDCKRFLD